jgi:hypothetical protein
VPGAAWTSRLGGPSARDDSAELGTAASAARPPRYRGRDDGPQHFVGGLHEANFLEISFTLPVAGHLSAIPVWHVQNDAKSERHFYKRAAPGSRTPAVAGKTAAPCEV